MTKMKQYPHYRASDIGWLQGSSIPLSWSTRRVKHLARMRSGDGITSEDIEPQGVYPVYGGNGVRGYTSAFTNEGTFPLIGRQGALCGNVHLARGRFWASEHAVVASPSLGVDTRWLAYCFAVMDLGQYSVATAQPGLTVGTIENLAMPVPPFAEQREIANFLDRETAKIDALIGMQEQLIETLRERRTALVLHSTLGATDVVWSGHLGRVLSKVDRHPTGENEVVTAYRNGVVTRRSLRRDEGYTFSDTEAGYQGVAKGDLVFHGLDGFAGAVGVSDADGDCSPVYHVCRPTGGDARFLAYLLRAMGVSGLLSAHAWSVRQRSVDYRNWALFAALPLALPSVAAQRETADVLDEQIEKIDVLVERAQRFIELSRERRSALISAAVTGQIDVLGEIALDDVLAAASAGVE